MTEEEFLMSLPQSLTRDEKIQRLEQWRQENPQPEVEEEEVITEQVEEDPFDIRSSSSLLSGTYRPFQNNDDSNMTLGEIQETIAPEQQRRDYEEKIESVAKENETYGGYDNDYEYKYTMDQNGPNYYSKPIGSSDDAWTLHKEKSNAYFKIGGSVFKHFEFDDKSYEKTNKALDDVINNEVLGKEFASLLSIYDTIDTEGVVDINQNQDGVDELQYIDNLYKTQVKLTEEEKIETNQQAIDYVGGGVDVELTDEQFLGSNLTKDGLIVSKSLKDGSNYNFSDNERWNKNIDVMVKSGTHGYNPKTGALVKLKEPLNSSKYYELQGESDSNREDFKNIAAVQIAQEDGLSSSADLDLENPEVQEKITERAIQLKQRELEDALRKEKLENVLEEDRTDIDWNNLGAAIVEKLALGVPMVGMMVDETTSTTEIWKTSDQNKLIGQYLEINKSNQKAKTKNLEKFLLNSKSLIGSISAQQLMLSKLQYETPDQLALAKKTINGLQKQKEDIGKLMEEKYNDLSTEIAKDPNFEQLIDLSKRNYGYIPILVNNAKASATDLGIGTANLVSEGWELYASTADFLDNEVLGDTGIGESLAGIVNPVYGITKALGIQSDIKEWKDNTIELTQKYVQETFRDTIAEAKSVKDLKGSGDIGTYVAATVGNVGPQVAAMAVNPTVGLGLVVSSSMGNSLLGDSMEMKNAQKALDSWNKNKPEQKDGESNEAYSNRLKDYNTINPRPNVPTYTDLQMWGGAMTTGALEFATGYFIKIPLVKGKSIVGPLLNRVKALNNPATKSAWSKAFADIGKKSFEWAGDATLEGLEEVGVGMGDAWYDRYVMGKDVNIFEGGWDNFSAGVIGGIGFKSIGIVQPYLQNVQTPGDISNIQGLQNEIKSISEVIIQNPKMSQKTIDILNKDINSKLLDINNSVMNSLNIFTEISENDFNNLGVIDQQLHNLNSQVEAVVQDPNIETGKEQLINDLSNKIDELTGQKNQLLEPYTKKDPDLPNTVVAPILKLREGADVVAEQLGSGIQRFDNTQDFLGGVESLIAQGVEIDLERNEQGQLLDAEDQGYGLIARLPDGTKQIIINNASSEADGSIPADKHEVLHLAAYGMDPAVKAEMGKDLLNSLRNDPNIKISSKVEALLNSYEKDLNDGKLKPEDFYEEVMAVTSDGLTEGGVDIVEIDGFKGFFDNVLKTIGWKQDFSKGMDVINFLKDFNADVLSGQGLSQGVLDVVDMGLETSVDLGTVKSSKLPESTEVYMDLSNEQLQQGLNEAIQNETDQQFPIAQAVVEKNWPLISKSLNINNQVEMDAAKEVVIDQILGQFQGSGQGKYPARKTSALQGFSLEGGAQVSTYLAETIRIRKPEIDAAIKDRTGGAGIDVSQAPDIEIETSVAEVETDTGKTPSSTTVYSDNVISNLNADNKSGIETQITEAIETDYQGEVVTLAQTRNIPTAVSEVYGSMFNLNPETIRSKKRNYSKKDSEGLTRAKQFLITNAQADYARLPNTLDADGKGTFIPKNVKDALYRDGKLVGTLKDYQDIIRIKPTKPIYRDRVGQTIRGLLNLHIRNRILETSQPDSAQRKKGGAKFSKKAPKKPTVKEVQKLEAAGFLSISDITNSDPIPTINIQKAEADKIYTGIRDQEANYSNKETYKQARDRVVGNFLASNPEWNDFIANSMAGGVTRSLFQSKQEYENATKDVPKDTDQEVIIRKSAIGTTAANVQGSNRLNPKGIREYNEVDQVKKVNDLVDFWVSVAEYLKTNKKDAWFFGEIIEDSKNNTSSPSRTAAGYSFYPIYPGSNNPNFETPILIEHGQPNLSANKPLVAAAMKGPEYVEALRKPTLASYGQGAIVGKDLPNGDDMVNVEYKSTMPDWFYTDVIQAIEDGKLNDLIKKYPGLIGPAARMSASGINLNYYGSPVDGKSIVEIILERKIPIDVIDGPMVNEAVNEAIKNRLSGMSKADVKERFDIKFEIAKLEDVAVKKFIDTYGAKVFPINSTVQEIRDIMQNSLETKVLASKKLKKPKGISLFDFDDTLANTKEKVIVNNPNGTTTEISASEFAKKAGQLMENGATFNFDNFEKVSEGTAEGPLADLARKRQGKFGSGDIFILTARPNSAGPAIQQFLKSIGINIPLANITGLGDGSPQAKVDFILNKAAEGYNDFYFADDSFANVEGVKTVLDAIDVKNRVELAEPKEVTLNREFNQQIEDVTGKEEFKKYSDARARLEGKQKDKGFFKRLIKQFTITPSADDFMGLMYAFAGKGEQGNKHLAFIKDNLLDPYNKAEQELLSAKTTVAQDFAELVKQFPNLKSKKGKNPLLGNIGVGSFTKSQAIRVYLWNKQGINIPGMSKRDVEALVKAVESDNELNVFADELGLIQKGEQYPAPDTFWLAGDIKTDILKGLDTSFRTKLMSEFNETADIIFSNENLNKIEAIYGSKYREALEDSIRRMKSGTNRPVFTGSGARIVNEMLDWLNSSVGAVMFFNMRSGLLQTLSAVNFVNWGDNNLYNAAKAFASKEYIPTVMKLMNSDYLVNRRDGLKINVNEAELADASKKGGFKGMVNYLLDKGFAITRIMDSLAIATGGATFYINRKKALLDRINKDTGKKYTNKEAEEQAFEDFYQIAEETQQSSNPSKISSQQASLAGRVILSFQNVTMQYNRKTKKSIQDLYNRRKKPGMTQRESDLSNVSSIMYYVGMQNLLFNSLQQGVFALAFDDEDEDKDKKETAANVVNGMIDSTLFGLGFGGALISTVKGVLSKIATESEKNSTQYREAIWDVFNISPVIDSKVRKLRTATKTFDWNKKDINKRGWSIDNPAYLAVSQVISATTNLPIDRVLQKINNLRQATDEQTKTWQSVALFLGWSGWNFGQPYWGRQSTIDRENKEEEKLKAKYKEEVRKIKADGYKKVPLTGPNSGKPSGKLGVDYVQIERPDGRIQYYKKI